MHAHSLYWFHWWDSLPGTLLQALYADTQDTHQHGQIRRDGLREGEGEQTKENPTEPFQFKQQKTKKGRIHFATRGAWWWLIELYELYDNLINTTHTQVSEHREKAKPTAGVFTLSESNKR